MRICAWKPECIMTSATGRQRDQAIIVVYGMKARQKFIMTVLSTIAVRARVSCCNVYVYMCWHFALIISYTEITRLLIDKREILLHKSGLGKFMMIKIRWYSKCRIYFVN